VADRSGDRRQLSFVRLWQKAIRVSDLPASARGIGWALSTWMDSETGACWPKHESIAEAAGTSVPTVRRGVLELERAGLLERSGTGGRGRPNHYHARIPDHLRARFERQGDQPAPETRSPKSAKVITGDQRSTQEVSSEAPSIEPEGSPAPDPEFTARAASNVRSAFEELRGRRKATG
jgi:hypothetical protein